MANPTPEELRRYKTHELLQLGFTRPEIKEAVKQARTGISQARPGFVDRFQASFATSPEDEAAIYRKKGYKARPQGENVVLDRPGGGYINVDPPGFDWGDVADVGGELPSIALGTAGGLTAGLTGLVTGPGAIAAAATGAAAGSGAGEWPRPQIAPHFGAEPSSRPIGAGLPRRRCWAQQVRASAGLWRVLCAVWFQRRGVRHAAARLV